ncbi:MAG: carboxypeptidase regulatory-like domain-containing protein, partial [Armatimonadetes bacterium]|nr:carboxypeptidase regulatory-like domain-containing protein [Armatimonadota bacterium]
MRRMLVMTVALGLTATCVFAGRLEVTVMKAGSPVGGALVRVSPGTSHRLTLADGHCAFAHLAAGTYRVVASKDVSGTYNAAVNPAAEVPADGTVSVTLTLTRAIMIDEYLPYGPGKFWTYKT